MAFPQSSSTRAEFFTNHYRVTANVTTGHRRLGDVLRDSTLAFLEVERIQVRRLVALDDEPVELQRGVLLKSDIHCAIIVEEVRGSAERLYAHVPKTPFSVFALLPSMEVVGQVHVEGVTDLLTNFRKGTERFIYLTHATLTLLPNPAEPISANVVIVNRDAVTLYCTTR